MSKPKNITVLGAGSMGCAMAAHLAWKEFDVTVWSPDVAEVEMLNEHREHLTRLPKIALPETIVFTNSFDEAVKGCEFFVLAVPAQFTRSTCGRLQQALDANGVAVSSVNVVTCSKGIEEDTGMILSDIMAEELPGAGIAVLSGPSHAEEIALKVPTAVVATSENEELRNLVQDTFITDNFRVYTNDDIVGVEVGGAVKNVIALCAGVSDGLGYGDNTKAALMTRGMVEMTRLGIAMGAKAETFAGLTGMGDLIVTCTSMHSRNRRFGILVGKGVPSDEALNEIGMVVEGYVTAKAVYQLAKKMNVSMPITESLYAVLYEGKEAGKVVYELMTRDKKNEHV